MMSRLKQVLTNEKEAWVRFVGAMFGLALAFTAATFSTVERISGNLVGSVILASVSLVIASAVAITTVPYLARRVTLRRVRDAFDYEVTREGAFYIGFTLLIGIAALNTGNNLLFIIVSAMLAAIIVSGIVSAAVLRSVDLELVLPRHVFAQTTFTARLKMQNLRRWLPALSVSVVVIKNRDTRAGRRAGAEREAARSQDQGVEPILQGPVYFPFIAAKHTAMADIQLRFERRGIYAQDQFGLMTKFPFSLFRKTRKLNLRQELIVYPAVQATDEMLDVLPAIRGEFESFVHGRGYDLYRIRDYVPEDSARHVDWKATARTGELKVREFTREDERKLRIVFDNPVRGALDSDGYERAVSIAASLAWHFSTEGTELAFSAPDAENAADVDVFLKSLAVAQPGSTTLDLEQFAGSGEWFNVIVTARPRGSIPTALWAKSYLIFMGE